MAKSKSSGGLIFLTLLIAGGGYGAWYYFGAKSEKAPEFQTTKVTRGDITQTVTATGDLQPVVTVDIGAQVSGQIKEVFVDFNSKVKAGDILAREAQPSDYADLVTATGFLAVDFTGDRALAAQEALLICQGCLPRKPWFLFLACRFPASIYAVKTLCIRLCKCPRGFR